FTIADLDLPRVPPSGDVPELFSHGVLGGDVVRYGGEPVAVVLAETRAAAEDAAEDVLVDYESWPAVAGVDAAVAEGATLLFPGHGSNVAKVHQRHWDEDVLENSDVVVRGRFLNQRLAPVPMEGNAVLAVPGEPEGGLTMYVSTQLPLDVRGDV